MKKRSKLKRFFKIAIPTLVAVIATLAIIDGSISYYMYSDMGAIPTAGVKYPAAHIKNVVWPTLCNPALVKPGYSFDVEVDLRGAPPGKAGTGAQPADAGNWQVTLTPIAKELAGLSSDLSVEKAWIGRSTKWPAGSRQGRSDSVWHLACRVPAGAPGELYDLKVAVDTGGRRLTDGQPHSVSVITDTAGDFRFITMADIHVHQRDVGGLFERITDKGFAADGTPLFLQTAIDEVNLIRPDFVVLVGDFVYAQRSPGEYQKEFAKFFAQLTRFEVPVFAVPGNHDLYVNQVDGKKVWEQNLGPLYYSFDVGGTHFTCANTFDWPADVRTVCEKVSGVFVYPRTGRGKVAASTDENNPSTYRHQLRWLADDLQAHQDSSSRVLFAHHDPYRPDGKGDAYSQKFHGIWPLSGDNGRKSLRKLCAEYRVNLLMSGHMHSDYVGKAPWSNGKGKTVFANQTCVYFDKGGSQNQYPGYRLVTVSGGEIEGYSYVDEFHSMPFYDGSNLEGKTDLDNLMVPAIDAEEAPELEDAGQPGIALIKSYLAVPIKLRGIMVVTPGAGGYQVFNGTVYQSVGLPGGNTALYIEATVPAGKPGGRASLPGTPARLWLSVYQ